MCWSSMRRALPFLRVTRPPTSTAAWPFWELRRTLRRHSIRPCISAPLTTNKPPPPLPARHATGAAVVPVACRPAPPRSVTSEEVAGAGRMGSRTPPLSPVVLLPPTNSSSNRISRSSSLWRTTQWRSHRPHPLLFEIILPLRFRPQRLSRPPTQPLPPLKLRPRRMVQRPPPPPASSATTLSLPAVLPTAARRCHFLRPSSRCQALPLSPQRPQRSSNS